MPVSADPSFGWGQATIAYATVLVASFLVTWVVTDRLHVPRTPYVGILTLVTLALGTGYLAWSGTPFADLLVPHWVWGIAAGLLAGAIVAPGLRRLPARGHAHGGALGGQFLWEGVVYGFAEAVLLATLPVVALWQAAGDLGWTEDTWGKVGSGVLAIVGSLLVIVIHHLGYREFRATMARPKLFGAMFGCGVQALAFLLTGNVLAPVIAHVLLHWQMIARGIELPPVAEGVSSNILDETQGPSKIDARGTVTGLRTR